MVVFHLFIGVVGRIGLDDVLHIRKLSVDDIGGQHIDRHGLGDRVCALHLVLDRLRKRFIKRILEVVERNNLAVIELAVDIRENLRLQTLLGNHARNQVIRIGAADGILDADAVFDVLDQNLPELCSVGIGGIFLRRAVVHIADENLRKQLVLGCLGTLGGGDIEGVGKQNLPRLLVADRNLCGLRLDVQFIAVHVQLFLHGCELVFLGGIDRSGIIRESLLDIRLIGGKHRKCESGKHHGNKQECRREG